MQLINIAEIQSGYISRGKIEPHDDGSHFLLQAKDVDADNLTYRSDDIIRFHANLSRKDWLLESGDVLFMARGVRNYSILLNEVPGNVLAAACFFIIRVSSKRVLPEYLFWYLNQDPVAHYLQQQSGRGVHMPIVRRSVLENIPIPVPPLDIQDRVAKLNGLMRREAELINKLAEKRRKIIIAACLQTVQANL